MLRPPPRPLFAIDAGLVVKPVALHTNMPRVPLPVPEAVNNQAEEDGSSPFDFARWSTSKAAKSALGTGKNILRGEKMQTSFLMGSFQPISSNLIGSSGHEVLFASGVDLNLLGTRTRWEDSGGPEMLAEVRSSRSPASSSSTPRMNPRKPDLLIGSGTTTGEDYFGGCGENMISHPCATLTDQTSSDFATRHRKSFAKAAWYLMISGAMCGTRHSLVMVNWSSQRLFQHDSVIYIELHKPATDLLPSHPLAGSVTPSRTPRLYTVDELFEMDIFGFEHLPHCTRLFGDGDGTGVDMDAAAAVWNFFMISLVDTVANATGRAVMGGGVEAWGVDETVELPVLASKKSARHQDTAVVKRRLIDEAKLMTREKRHKAKYHEQAAAENAEDDRSTKRRRLSSTGGDSTPAQRGSDEEATLTHSIGRSSSLELQHLPLTIANVDALDDATYDRTETISESTRRAHSTPEERTSEGSIQVEIYDGLSSAASTSAFTPKSGIVDSKSQADRADRLAPSDSYSQADSSELKVDQYLDILRGKVRFCIITPTMMDEIYSTIAAGQQASVSTAESIA